jgi:hypothetical protein
MAKKFYAHTAEQFIKLKKTSPYIQGLLFPKQFNTADSDVVAFK